MGKIRHVSSSRALGQIIRDRRKSLGLTQLAAGKLVGVHQTTLSDVENGKNKVKIDTLMKIIAALRLELLIQPIPSHDDHWEKAWEDNGA